VKKLSVLIALVLLALAGTGYAQSQETATAEAAQVLYPPLPEDRSVAGLRTFLDNIFGDEDRARYYQEVPPCRVFDTRSDPQSWYLRNGETRTFQLPDAGSCGLPNEAVDAVVQVTTYGIYARFGMMPGFLYFTTPNAISLGGLALGYGLAPFAYFEVGVWTKTRGVVQLATIPGYPHGYKGLGIKALYGDVFVVVDLIGYTTRRAQ